jgi:hypothetical protein
MRGGQRQVLLKAAIASLQISAHHCFFENILFFAGKMSTAHALRRYNH